MYTLSHCVGFIVRLLCCECICNFVIYLLISINLCNIVKVTTLELIMYETFQLHEDADADSAFFIVS
jgi:hypothetical protein